MITEDKDRSGYYQSIARAFVERRGAPFFLSPRDQSLIAAWEARRIPLRVVLEAIGRTFDGLKSRGRNTKGISLGFCERHVDEAFGQHKDRGAGGRGAAGAKPEKRDRARREVEKALESLPSEEHEIAALLRAALSALDAPKPDEAVLERIDAEIEELLWAGATDEDKAGAETEARRGLRGRPPAGLADTIRRSVVRTARTARRIPHVSLFYH
jgi:hypothetical protein